MASLAEHTCMLHEFHDVIIIEFLIVYRLLLQKIKVSNQAIALIGVITTVIGYLMFTDFQAIPYDPCTEYSPFHHPEITDYNKSIGHAPISNARLHPSQINQTTLVPLSTMISLQFSNRVRFGFPGINFDLSLGTTDNYTCKQVTECSCNFTQPCLSIPLKDSHHKQIWLQPGIFQCSNKVHFCVFLSRQSPNELNVKETKKKLELANINSILYDRTQCLIVIWMFITEVHNKRC